jgi:hypothetical protein
MAPTTLSDILRNKNLYAQEPVRNWVYANIDMFESELMTCAERGLHEVTITRACYPGWKSEWTGMLPLTLKSVYCSYFEITITKNSSDLISFMFKW